MQCSRRPETMTWSCQHGEERTAGRSPHRLENGGKFHPLRPRLAAARSFADFEPRDERHIAVRIVAADVIEQPAPPAHHHQQTPPAGMILLVLLEMPRQLVDAGRED